MITNPSFSDEPAYDDDHVREGDPEAYDSASLLGTLEWLTDTSRLGDQRLPRKRGFSLAAARAASLLYAPELNPDEGIWKHRKYVELKNVCCAVTRRCGESCAKPRSV